MSKDFSNLKTDLGKLQNLSHYVIEDFKSTKNDVSTLQVSAISRKIFLILAKNIFKQWQGLKTLYNEFFYWLHDSKYENTSFLET